MDKYSLYRTSLIPVAPQLTLACRFTGTCFAAWLAARRMVEQGTGGSIVMIASVASYTAVPSQRVSIYSASRAAVRLLAGVLGVVIAPHNIRINSLSPGFIETNESGSITVANPEGPYRINKFSSFPPEVRLQGSNTVFCGSGRSTPGDLVYSLQSTPRSPSGLMTASSCRKLQYNRASLKRPGLSIYRLPYRSVQLRRQVYARYSRA
jgi:short chain dehydrogenase